MSESTCCIRLPEELFALAESSPFHGELSLPLLSAGPDEYSFAEPLVWDVLVTNIGDALVVSGAVTGEGSTQCARCLDEFTVPFAGEIEGYYLLDEDTPAPEDMDEDEYEVLSEDHVIDLEPLIIAAIILELPLVPLCREDCKGLCPSCGANLNDGPCGCEEKPQDDDFSTNPFAVLKDLQFDEE